MIVILLDGGVVPNEADDDEQLCDGCDEDASLDCCPQSRHWLCRRCCANCNAARYGGACLYADTMHWDD